MNNKKLALRRVKNRKRPGLEKHYWRKMNNEIYAVAESSLPGYRWVQRRNPNDSTGFSWYEEPIRDVKIIGFDSVMESYRSNGTHTYTGEV